MLDTFRSKRVWTIIFLFVVNGVAGISESISPGVLQTINAILAALGVVFGLPGVKSKS